MGVIGHVDSGKSTLVGQLSVASGNINAKTTRNLQKIADNNSKSSFALAYAMDSTESERKRGVTIDVGSAQIIELESYNLALLGFWFDRYEVIKVYSYFQIVSEALFLIHYFKYKILKKKLSGGMGESGLIVHESPWGTRKNLQSW